MTYSYGDAGRITMEESPYRPSLHRTEYLAAREFAVAVLRTISSLPQIELDRR